MTASGQVARMLALLPSAQREVLRLRLVVQLSVEETAAVLETTPEAVTTVQKRALLLLRGEFIASRRRQPED